MFGCGEDNTVQRAAEHCLRAVEIQHFYPDAHYTLGVALTWLKDYEHAIRSFRVALSMRPGMIDAHRFLASIFRHLGDRKSARPHRDAPPRPCTAPTVQLGSRAVPLTGATYESRGCPPEG